MYGQMNNNSNWSEVFTLQSEWHKKLPQNYLVVLTPEEIEKMAEKPTENLDAYQPTCVDVIIQDNRTFRFRIGFRPCKAIRIAVRSIRHSRGICELARAHARLIFLRQDLSELRLEKQIRQRRKH